MAERTEASRRPVPWLALAVLLGLPAGLVLLRLMEAAGLHLPACIFHRVTGLPCATCGMTRMARALAAGDLGAAFHWHPVAAALLLLSPLAALWDLRRAWRGEAFPQAPDAAWARILAVGLFATAWVLQIARGI